jgi:hypothetical protein
MQRETRLPAPPVSADGLRWPAPETARPALLSAVGLLFALSFLLSLVFSGPFARVGITAPSILLGALLIVVSATCGRDPLHPARILAAILALGFVIGPVVSATIGVYALPNGYDRQLARLESATWMLFAGVSLAMLMMRLTLGDRWSSPLEPKSRAPISRRTLGAAIGVAVVGIAALGLYLILTGGSIVSLQGRGATYAVIPDEGRKAYLSLLAPIGLGGFLLIAAWALERGSRFALALSATAAIGFGVLMALPGSRANLLYAVAPLFFLYAAYRGLPRWRWLAAGAVVLTIALVYGASLRTADVRSELVRDPVGTLSEHGPTRDNVQRSFVVDVAHTDSLLGAMDAYPSTRPFLGGESAALGFTGPAGWKFGQLIGLKVDPPAGVTLTAVAYGRDPSTFSSGVTATLPGELYANAGVPAVIFGLALFGAILGWLRRAAVASQGAGSLALYAAALTILFAAFADYFGQFYRGGAVAIGVALALIAGHQLKPRFARVAAVVGLIGALALGLLTAHRLLGPPPAELLTSSIPVYLTLGGLTVFVGAITARFSLRRERLQK